MNGFRFDEPPPEFRNLERMKVYEAAWGTVPNGSGQTLVALFRPRMVEIASQKQDKTNPPPKNKNKWGPPTSIALLAALRTAINKPDLLLPKDMEEVKRNLSYILQPHAQALAS